MPGLSPDPEKRERQLAGLREGRRRLAVKVMAEEQPHHESSHGPRVRDLDYDEHVPPPAAPAAVEEHEHEQPPAPAEPAVEPPVEPAVEPPERRAGFLDGFLGRW
jgi:hypothetical protein